jgi:hypothetical protein
MVLLVVESKLKLFFQSPADMVCRVEDVTGIETEELVVLKEPAALGV